MGRRAYIRLIRFEYHVTFIGVVCGALLFTKAGTAPWYKPLLLLYASFNVLLYGGIYTMNAVADVASDRRHPLKRKRPLPSKAIPMKSAVAFSAVFITAGLLSGLVLFNGPVFHIYIAVLALNVFYTFVAKKVPYLELIINGLTHMLRFLMGVLLVGAEAPRLFLLAIFCLAFGLAGVRRSVEKDVPGWEVRKTLKFYSTRGLIVLELLAFLVISLLWVTDPSVPRVFYGVLAAVYIVLVGGAHLSGPVRHFFRFIWTR